MTLAPCALLAAILPKDAFENPNVKWTLCSFSSSRVGNLECKLVDTVSIDFGHGTGFNALVPQLGNTSFVRRISKDWVDLERLVKGWIQFCQDKHTKACTIKRLSPGPLFKPIDCKTRKVVLALDHPYVTLSYLLGSQKKHEFCDTLLKTLPLTIEDSITGTRRLGFRYLWVDTTASINRTNEKKWNRLQKWILSIKCLKLR